MARGSVVRVFLPGGGCNHGVVIEARPAAAPTRVKVLWEPLEDLRVTEHDWPPAQATIVGAASLKVSRAPRRRAASVEEPVGFSEWLGAHVMEAERHGVKLSVPGAGTTRRAKLAATFARLLGEGESVARLKAASVGVLDDEFMRSGGHVDPENVLRVEKVGRRADAGERVLAARVAAAEGGATDWERFDG
jgi:hypothetical protein